MVDCCGTNKARACLTASEMSDEEMDLPGMLPLSNDILQALLAAKRGDPNKFQSFWEMDEEGVDEDSMEEIQKDPKKKILWAAENNEIEVVKELLENQADLVNSRDADGYTPLHRACYNGHVDVVKFLLDHGANKEAKTDDGWRPLHSASRWNQTEVISLLLQCGVNINAQTNGGHTALHLASTDKDNRDALEILLKDENIDTGIRNSMGETAYEICRRTSDNCLLFEEREKSINKQTES